MSVITGPTDRFQDLPLGTGGPEERLDMGDQFRDSHSPGRAAQGGRGEDGTDSDSGSVGLGN